MTQQAKSAEPAVGFSLAPNLMALTSIAVLGAVLLYVFWDGLAFMVANWDREEYSHGYLIPVIALLMAWQNWPEVAKARDASGAWAGTAIIVLGLAIFVMGELGTLFVIIQYAFLITLVGIAVTYLGWRSLRHLWVPFCYLAFMIPLPQFLYTSLSTKLQLISSEIGVAVIKLAGISVLLEGNVIDLGVYKLQVAEACSGLRYLFPLMSFGFLIAYLYRAPLWHKALVFLSTIPITIFMNSLRVGVVGILVEYYGIEQALGFLHDFEGWIIFMACVAILFLEIWLLIRLTGRKGRLASFFNLNLPGFDEGSSTKRSQFNAGACLAALCLLLVTAVGISLNAKRAEAVVTRESFFDFPIKFGNWRGSKAGLPTEIVRTLKVDDYIMANYARPKDRNAVNFYVSYYNSQRKGQAVHSPQACIPGDGWEITGLRTQTVPGVGTGKAPVTVNRVIIAKGLTQHLVYYWFPQRGRHLTNEYAVKWYIFWDALTRNRTDGAMVRLVTPIEGNNFMAAEARLSSFLKAVYPQLGKYIPN